VTFFDQPPPEPPPRPPSYRTPEWLVPPENVIPATVALDAVLVRREDLAIWVADALVYPTGLGFGLFVHRRVPDASMEPPFFFRPPTEDGPRFGLLLADGQKVLVERLGDLRPFLEQPTRAVLRPRSGGGGTGGRSHAEMWLWPLPPPGPLRFVCEWPAEGIAETAAEVDATAIVEAAARAVEMWPDDRPLPPDEESVLI
jgi:hypothetical protein